MIHDSHDFSVFARNESDALQGYEQLSTSINSLHNLSATKISADESFKTCLRVMIVDGLVVSSVVNAVLVDLFGCVRCGVQSEDAAEAAAKKGR